MTKLMTLTRRKDEDELTAESLNLRINMAELLLDSGGLNEQLYGRHYHKEQHCLRLFGGF
jgi:hypothetical protein